MNPTWPYWMQDVAGQVVYRESGLLHELGHGINAMNHPFDGTQSADPLDGLMDTDHGASIANGGLGRDDFAPYEKDWIQKTYGGGQMTLVFDRLPVEDCIVTGAYGQSSAPWSSDSPHQGIDLAPHDGLAGRPVVNPCRDGGTVVPFNNDGSFGTAVCVFSGGLYVLLPHLVPGSTDGIAVMGEWYPAGHVFGAQGMSGAATGIHTHWGVCRTPAFPKNDLTQNLYPMAFLQPEVDLMNAAMQEMMAIATGNFEAARVAYNALLVAPAIFDEADLTGGHLDPAAVGLNEVLTRWRVLEHVALTNAAAAIARLG